MGGAAGDSILTGEHTGDQGDITADTGMAIIMDTGGGMVMGMVMGTGPVMPQAREIPTGMYIITAVQVSDNPAPGEIHRLQTILTTGPGLRTSLTTCTLIKAGMYTSVIRMEITKTSRTDRHSRGSDHLQGSNLPPVNDLPPVSGLRQVSNPQPVSDLPLVSNHVLIRARHKTINANKWTGPIKTGAREHKTITGHNSTSNKTEADQAALVEAAQEEPDQAVAVAVAEDDNSLIKDLFQNNHLA